MSVHKRVLAAAVALLTSTAGLVAVTSEPAFAVGCPLDSVCVHDPDQFGLPLQSWPASFIASRRCVNITDINNRTTSWRNTSARRFQAFDAANCAGTFGMYSIFEHNESGNVGPTWNDKASSIKLIS